MDNIINETKIKATAAILGIVVVCWGVWAIGASIFSSVSNTGSMYDRADAITATAMKPR